MKISEFIEQVKTKKVLPDINLPKYQNLRREVVPDKHIPSAIHNLMNSEVEIEESEPAIFSTSSSDNALPEHIEEIISKEFIDLEKFITGEEEITTFNKDIVKYLWQESGFGVGFKNTNGNRPGNGRNRWNIDAGLVSFSEGYCLEDQAVFGSLDQKIINKVRPGWIDRIMGVISKKYYDKVFKNSLKDYVMSSDGKRFNSRYKNEDVSIINLKVVDFFNRVKLKISESEALKNHIKTIFEQISNAKKMGQTSLLEMLAVKMVVEVYEGALIAGGYNKYITLEDLGRLEKNSPRGLSLDLIHNFSRIIPPEVVEKKMMADGLCVFDQYVILHFDPENKNTAKTTNQIENEKKKDPILFGLILDSDKLYYVADWIDEYCDLTWDKALEILGDEEKSHTLELKK